MCTGLGNGEQLNFFVAEAGKLLCMSIPSTNVAGNVKETLTLSRRIPLALA